MSFSFGLMLASQIIHLDGGVALVPGRKKETLTIRKFFCWIQTTEKPKKVLLMLLFLLGICCWFLLVLIVI